MSNVLRYKGYIAKIQFSSEDELLHGKIEGIRDHISFESESAADIMDEFRDAVNDYLDMCKELGRSPDKVYNGVFNVRIDKNLHRKIAEIAIANNVSLNACVEDAICDYVEENEKILGAQSMEIKPSKVVVPFKAKGTTKKIAFASLDSAKIE